MIRGCLIFLYLLFSIFSSAQIRPHGQTVGIKSIGLPMITSYTPADYNLTNQNFDVMVGDDGKIYFANRGGILVYDGNHWTHLKLPNDAAAYSLSKAKDGTIYVGGVNEVGYLTSEVNGRLAYVSLAKQTELSQLGSFVAVTVAVENDIIFYASNKIVIYSPQKSESTIIDAPDPDYRIVGKSHDGLYSIAGDSLYQLINKKWEAVRKSTLIPREAGKGLLLSLNDDRSWTITENGIFYFDTEEPLEIAEEVLSLLHDVNIYSAKVIAEKFVIISTWNGLVILDFSGNLIQYINKDKGLTDNFLFGSDIDGSEMLWVATNNGISKIDLFSSLSYMSKQMGLNGITTDLELHHGNAYVSMFSGVFRESWSNLLDPFILPQFEKITSDVAHGLLKTENDIIVLNELQHNTVISKNGIDKIAETEGRMFWTGISYPGSQDLLLGSNFGKLIHVSKEGNRWTIINEIESKILSARPMVLEYDMNVWVSSLGEGVFRLTYDKDKRSLLSEKKYTKADGLPSDLNNIVFSIENKLLFGTDKGVYKYLESKDRFVPDDKFTTLVGEVPVLVMESDSKGNIYYYSEQLYMLRKKADGYEKISFPNIDYKRYSPDGITAIDPENVLITTTDGLIHLNPTLHHEPGDFSVNVTSLKALNADTLFYEGFGLPPADLAIKPEFNALRVAFSAAFYQNPEKIQYRWRLNSEGEEWSNWSNEVKKDYTNLSHGNYLFEVVARNAYGVESAPASISFSVSRPWFHTFWAYACYVVAFIAFVWLIVRVNSRRLQLDKARLEQLVEDRTQEINEQKEKVEEQHQKLLKADDLKKRFFVNISHELRTPLTLSMGTIDQALKGTYGELNEELNANLNVSKRNNERLLKMVTSILDISKLEGGRIQLHASESDPSTTIKKVLAFFSSRFEEKQIQLITELKEGASCYLDLEKFETIVINLLSNALKFTEIGGTVKVRMKELEDEVILEVGDSGEGIPEEDPAIVFDRFYQSPSIKSGEGIGVGLALTKELVELHQGTITASNEDGAVFSLTFKKGADHLYPEQIVKESENATNSLTYNYPLHNNTIVEEDTEEDYHTTEHILLVEDNAEMSQFISSILNQYYNVSTVFDGKQALEYLEKQKPDLIVTDYLMPNMDGYEMAVEIKKSQALAHIPIIFLTARAREQDKINVLNLGVDDYLFKPFSQEELLIRIKNLFYNRKQREEFVLEESLNPEEIEWKDFSSKIRLKVDEYISAHIKEEITADQLAEHANQSERTLYRKVKANTGLSVLGYVKEYRLRRARIMLENQEMPTVSEISYAVGFNYLSHFTKSYKERFGKQPSEYLE